MTKAILLIAAMAAAAAAQSSNGYLFAAPGGITSQGYTRMTIHAGGGADLLFARGLGVNLELGALSQRDDIYYAVGLLSAGGTFYPRRGKELKVEPFLAGGYSLMFPGSATNMLYYGGGVNCWVSRKFGVRLELRDHVDTASWLYHYWGFRIGFAMR